MSEQATKVPETVDRDSLSDFFEWWAADQRKMAQQNRASEYEFYCRAEAFADAARAVREGEDLTK